MSGGVVERRLYLLSFFDELGPLFALVALWFLHSGLSATDISWVFLFWALVALLLEIPSGALADRVERRRLIVVAVLLRAAGIATWMLWPTLPGILVGVMLWAIHGALWSGTWESLIHDLVAPAGGTTAYTRVMARTGQANQAGIAGGTLIAAAVLRLDGTLPLLGWLTVALHALSVVLILRLPPAPRAEPDEAEDMDEADTPLSLAAWLETLREGVRAAMAHATLRRLVVVGALLEGLFILDEYQPLLGSARGATEAEIPFLVLVIWVGLMLGGELAARRPHLSGPVVGGLLCAAALLTMMALWSGSVHALYLLGVGYAAQNTAWIISDARFQQQAPRQVRATVTSVRAFLGVLLNMGAFALVAGLSVGEDPVRGVLILVGVLLVTGGLLMAWLPASVRESAQ
jgi:MFS family permease